MPPNNEEIVHVDGAIPESPTTAQGPPKKAKRGFLSNLIQSGIIKPPSMDADSFPSFGKSSSNVVPGDVLYEDSGLDEKMESIAENKKLFRLAYRYLDPSRAFRAAVYLYGERRLVVFFLLHFIATMVIWVHFALIKFEEQKNGVPDGAPRYWWKRVVPPLEFGSMHAILFQMALLPLTMARYSIAALSDSIVDRYVPLNRALRLHIHLGYTMVGIVFLATVVFFTFFGLLCSDGDESFCDKFTSEIMCTGYGILASLLIIGGTSYFRYKIPYEVFYAIHHLVFAMYIITIAHTFDDVHRNEGRERSQTVKWFSSTLVLYMCDRACMHLNHKYKTRIIKASAEEGSDGKRVVIMKLKRPVLFQFKPGQYAFLKMDCIDNQWHPFSIASGPADEELEFFIEVFGANSWSWQLWELLAQKGSQDLEFEIMGPYGTSLGSVEKYSHGLAIGAGTGIVPVLSMFKQHARQLLHLSPEAYLEGLKQQRELRQKYDIAVERQKGTLATNVMTGACCQRKPQELGNEADDLKKSFLTQGDRVRASILRNVDATAQGDESNQAVRDLKKRAHQATQSIYGCLIMGLQTVFGSFVLGITISWNTLHGVGNDHINVPVYDGMYIMMIISTLLFQVMFAVTASFAWDKNTVLAFVDMGICALSVPADWLFYQQYKEREQLRGVELATFTVLVSYMIYRFWTHSVAPRHLAWQEAPADAGGRGTLECLKVTWVARSASLIGEIVPDIDEIWSEILKKWTFDEAVKVVSFNIYCTDPDEAAKSLLVEKISHTKLHQQGFVHFSRPNFGKIVEDHTLELISTDENRHISRSSSTLFAFCGSPILAKQLHQCKVSNDIVTAITGYKNHQMEFISESYGGVKSPKHNNSLWQMLRKKKAAGGDVVDVDRVPEIDDTAPLDETAKARGSAIVMTPN